MRVRELMNPLVVTIDPEESAALAARLLSRHNLGALPVCGEDGALRGIVTDRDIVVRCVAADREPARVAVREIMTCGVETVAPDAEVEEAARRMARQQVRRLPVTREGRVVGMLSLGDLARSPGCGMEAAAALSDICQNVKPK